MAVFMMVVAAVAIILLVKFGLLKGIEQFCGAMQWSAKVRGQVTGYATSVPELVCLVAAGLSGVWEVGLWNIASSNIINTGLILIAVCSYRQFRELLNRRFIDEICFAGLAVAVPLCLMKADLDTQWYLVPVLLGFFAIYQVVDRVVNPPSDEVAPATTTGGSLPMGVLLGAIALAAIAVVGMFLGEATANVVDQLGVHPAMVGWILGTVTSLPEVVSFFTVYGTAAKEGRLQDLQDTQEALDNLTGSNMANAGVVYPMGLLAFLMGSFLVGCSG